MNMKSVIKLISTTLPIWALLLTGPAAMAFCGFYVARADANLFNNKSEVIMVRDGKKMVITMSNDFKGNVKDFAMVVPVPVVLKESDIRVVRREIFDQFNAYSAPRLVEYWDENPCYPTVLEEMAVMDAAPTATRGNMKSEVEKKKDYKVTIEATYTVGEYDILILSATESNGLKEWLKDNGYKIPESAHEVLDPYIRSGLKFFVVKVNLEKMQGTGFEYLRPLQIKFESERFMLPIRLGMANANGDQDMIVYALTRSGRVETANYRTALIPSNRNVPLYVQERFGKFYIDLFEKAWKREGKNAVMLEYAWNVSPSFTGMKCDPCVGPPPMTEELAEAGVDWLNDVRGAQVFLTRLHVRYNRQHYPSDLVFQITPNREHFQGRYILTHPATGDLSCVEGRKYLQDLVYKRQRETAELASLTGWDTSPFEYYTQQYERMLRNYERDTKKNGAEFPPDNRSNQLYWLLIGAFMMAGIGLIFRRI